MIFVPATAQEIEESELIWDIPAVFVEKEKGPSVTPKSTPESQVKTLQRPKEESEVKTTSQKTIASHKRELDKKAGPQNWHKYATCNKCHKVGHVKIFCPPDSKHEKPEALVNGPRFDVSHVKQAIGWAEVRHNGILSNMNCVAVWNGFRVCEHIFIDGSNTVTFSYGDVEVSTSRDKGKKIGNDSLFFPRTKEFEPLKHIKPLQTALPVQGAKVRLIAFDSKEDQKNGRDKSDDGIVKCIIDTPGQERAYVGYSSVNGSCTGPVVDVNGKLVGIHNATAATDNVFVPITAHMVHVATGSKSSF